MGRKCKLTEMEILWAHIERCRGCDIQDVAAHLNVSPRTVQRAFRLRGLRVPKAIPDESALQEKAPAGR